MKQREIKFRAWDGNEMWYQGQKNTTLVFFGQPDRIPFGIYNNADGSRLMTGDENAIFNTPSTLMQFTGLKDKNGVDIYEGDIVKWGHVVGGEENPIRVAQVKINPDIQFCITNHKGLDVLGNSKTFNFGNFIYTDTEKYLEVIGNIYENPELINQPQQP